MKKWVVYLLSCAITVPAHAQFPIIPLEVEPQAPPAPPADADVALWLKNLNAAKEAAEKAAVAGDLKKRDAAIQDAAKWATKVADPYGVKATDVRKAFEMMGELARRMRVWKTTFGPTKLVMLDVRAGDVIRTAQGADKAKLLAYQGDLKIAQDYAVLSFDWWEKVLAVPEADPALVKYAITSAVETVSNSDRPKLKPFFARMLALPLTPNEQAEWKLKQQLYVIDTEYKGEEREAAIAAVKALAENPKTPLAKRHELFEVYADTLYGPEKEAFVEKMITTMAPHPTIAARWIFKRGILHAGDKEWAQAVADYRTGAEMLPVGSADRDSYLWTAARLGMQHLGEKQQVVPDLELAAKSKNLPLLGRYEAAFLLHQLAFGAKDYAKAKTYLAMARAVAEQDIILTAKADLYLARTQSALGEHETAIATWRAVPRDKLTDNGQEEIRKGVYNEVAPIGVELYSAAANAKNYASAQAVLDYAAKNYIFPLGDLKLLETDLLVRQAKYDEAIIVLKALDVVATSPADKSVIANAIANIQKQKADAAGKPTTN